MASLSAGPAETIRILRQMDEEFVRAVAARDVHALVENFYADDARVLPEHHPEVLGKAAIREFWEANFAAGVSGLALDTTHVEVSGNLAYGVGQYSLVVDRPDGESAQVTGKYVVVYRRQDNLRWRAVVDMFSTDSR